MRSVPESALPCYFCQKPSPGLLPSPWSYSVGASVGAHIFEPKRSHPASAASWRALSGYFLMILACWSALQCSAVHGLVSLGAWKVLRFFMLPLSGLSGLIHPT